MPDDFGSSNQSDALVSHLEAVCEQRHISLPGENLPVQNQKLSADIFVHWTRMGGSMDFFVEHLRDSILNEGENKDKPEAWMKTETIKRTEKLLEIQILSQLHEKHKLKLSKQGDYLSDPYDYFFLHKNTRKVIESDERYRDDLPNVEKAKDSARKMIEHELKRFRSCVLNSAVC